MSRRLRVGVVMDPIGSIKPAKDSTLALLLAAQARGHELRYMEPRDLFLRGPEPHARTREVRVRDDLRAWYELGAEAVEPLAALDVVLMRQDPPFTMEYVYNTYVLEHAEAGGVLVVNRPQALRDTNEKLAILAFPECIAPTLVAREMPRLREFLAEHGDVVLKPLDAMGGSSVFRLRADDPNVNVVLETMTAQGTRFAMAQRYLPEIAQGDKRILLIDGEPVPYALARMPAPGETRANLAAGGTGVGVPLTGRDRWICAQVGPQLKRRGLVFVGLDVIGEYLTEINVTSPTCIRELDKLYDLDIGARLFEVIEAKAPAERRTRPGPAFSTL